MTRKRRDQILTLAMLLAAAPRVLAQVECPLFSSGGSLQSDGTILILGQLATQIVGSGADELRQGAVHCYPANDCPGDATGDGRVDESDLGLLLSNWQANVAPDTLGDLTGDGRVDESDLGLLLSRFGTACS